MTNTDNKQIPPELEKQWEQKAKSVYPEDSDGTVQSIILGLRYGYIECLREQYLQQQSTAPADKMEVLKAVIESFLTPNFAQYVQGWDKWISTPEAQQLISQLFADQWVSVEDQPLPIGPFILVAHPYGIEAIHFDQEWRYWYSATPIPAPLLKSITHFYKPTPSTSK